MFGAIDRRVVRSAIYAVVTALLVVLFKGTEWAIEHFVADSGKASMPVALGIAISCGLVFQLFHHRVEHGVMQWLNRHARKRSQGLSDLAVEVGLIRDEETLARRVVARMDQLLGMSGCSMYLVSGQETLRLASCASEGLPPEVRCDDPAVIQSTLRRNAAVPEASGSKMPMPMVWPMLARGTLVGLIGAGRRERNESLDQAEIEAVMRLAEAAGSALMLLDSGLRRRAAPQPALAAPVLPLPGKPSIAVLPFQNLSGDAHDECFADGVVEEITTALSKFPLLFVISRNSTVGYKGRSVEVKQIGRELGVRYVLQGSVRREAKAVRITGELIDTTTGEDLWTDRFDGGLEDIFALQDRIAESVLGAIGPKVERAEIRRVSSKSTESLDAYECYHRALSHVYRITRDDNDAALLAFRKAIALDPSFALAHARMAIGIVYRRASGWMKDPVAESAEGCELARRALSLSPGDPIVLSTAGFVLCYLNHEVELGARLVERSLSLSTNFAEAWAESALVNVCLGKPEQGLEHAKNAMRLSPLDSRIYVWQTFAGLAALCAGRYEEACDWSTQSLAGQPDLLGGLRVAAASYAMAGRLDEARAAAGRLVERDPSLRLSNIILPPYRRASDRSRIIDALRLAGVPE